MEKEQGEEGSRPRECQQHPAKEQALSPGEEKPTATVLMVSFSFFPFLYH